jgi:hypothetical protein
MERNGWWIKERMDATFALFNFVMYPNISLKICCNLQSPKSNLIKEFPSQSSIQVFFEFQSLCTPCRNNIILKFTRKNSDLYMLPDL